MIQLGLKSAKYYLKKKNELYLEIVIMRFNQADSHFKPKQEVYKCKSEILFQRKNM